MMRTTHAADNALGAEVVRSAAIRGFADVVTELGGSPYELAARAGLPAAALTEEDLTLDATSVSLLLELAAEELECPDLGLRVAGRQDETILGPLALAVQNAGTVREAIGLVSTYIFVHSPVLRVRLVPDPDGRSDRAALSLTSLPGLPLPTQSVDLAIGAMHRACRSIGGELYRPIDVLLPHPPDVDPGPYRAFFGTPIQLGRTGSCIRVPSEVLETELRGGDPGVRAIALHYLDLHAGRYDPVGPQVRIAIERSLEESLLTLSGAARLLGVHVRTLQRRLASEGTSWERVLDEVRQERVHRSLTLTRTPIGEVSRQVGLSEQSALTRCAHRWWGRTPTQVRRDGR